MIRMFKVINHQKQEAYIKKYQIQKYISEQFLSLLELVLFKKGEHICKVGEKNDYLFFFVDGKAKLYITMDNGKSLLLYFYTPFKILGEVEFLKNERAQTNVQCVEDSYCLALPIVEVREALSYDPIFLRYVSEQLGKKLEYVSMNSSVNLLYPLENRLASYIVMAVSDEEQLYFQENLTHVSELLGTSYRHLLRTFQALCEKGILEKQKNRYRVVDKDGLYQMAVESMFK